MTLLKNKVNKLINTINPLKSFHCTVCNNYFNEKEVRDIMKITSDHIFPTSNIEADIICNKCQHKK